MVIDDQAFTYLDVLRDDGYNVDKWDDVKDLDLLVDPIRCDLVLLDMHGVGVSQTTRQGLGVLEHIKKVAPVQLVICYSAGKYPFGVHDSLSIADAIIPKDADYVEFRRRIDEQLRKRYSEEYYVSAALAVLGADDPRMRRVLQRAVRSADPEDVPRLLAGKLRDGSKASTVMQIVQTGAAVASFLLQVS